MQKHWPDLITFLDHPEIDLDNNAAERAIRPAVVGRKIYYGSGSQASGQLAAMMLSLFGTLDLWQINPRTWLIDYLQACGPSQKSGQIQSLTYAFTLGKENVTIYLCSEETRMH